MKVLHCLSSVGGVTAHVGEIGVLGEVLRECMGIMLVPCVHETGGQFADCLLVVGGWVLSQSRTD
jgi:hypothetical protein